MTTVGYARVSTLEQDPALQQEALERAGCERVFTDHASGVAAERPGLADALAYLRPGDTLVVWRLDRLGRSLRHLLEVVGTLGDRGVEFRTLTEALDTSTSSGRLLFGIVAAVAEFERDLIRERTMAGLAVARARGRKGGRKAVLSAKSADVARAMYAAGDSTVAEIAAVLGVSRATIYRSLAPMSSETSRAGLTAGS